MSSRETDPTCVFCRIVAGELPATMVHDGSRVLAFSDLSPAAPTHVIVVPKAHYRDVEALAAADPEALAELVAVSAQVARDAGTPSYRLVFNTGADAGQSVGHTHGHVLAGRALGWPPG